MMNVRANVCGAARQLLIADYCYYPGTGGSAFLEGDVQVSGNERTASETLAEPQWSVGLDFGTAFSKAALAPLDGLARSNASAITPLRLGDAAGWAQPFLTPSAMFLDRERVHLGARAVERLRNAGLPDRELVRSFKKVLGSVDFEGTLQFFPRPSVDPDRLFRLHDLIVLYLAYLLALVDEAGRRATGSPIIASSLLKFTRPGWIPERIAAAHENMATLFAQAHAVYATLGATLCAAEGLPYQQARAALDAAREASFPPSSLDGGIYEASAVGLCYFLDPGRPNCMMIVDVGGGTTDIAGLMRPSAGDVGVIRASRRTIDIAGDDFDAVLADLLLAKAKLKSMPERAGFWRTLSGSVRDLKAELVANGSTAVAGPHKNVACTSRDFENHPSFRECVSKIEAVYEQCLFELADAARADRLRTIGIVLAGGGAHLPALRAALCKRTAIGPIKLEFLPSIPPWLQDRPDAREFEPFFPQLSAAIGAAISRTRDEAPEQGGARETETAVLS